MCSRRELQLSHQSIKYDYDAEVLSKSGGTPCLFVPERYHRGIIRPSIDKCSTLKQRESQEKLAGLGKAKTIDLSCSQAFPRDLRMLVLVGRLMVRP